MDLMPYYRRFKFLSLTVGTAALALILRIEIAEKHAQKGLFVTTSFVVAEDKKEEKKDDKKEDHKDEAKLEEKSDKKADEKSVDKKDDGEHAKDDKTADDKADKEHAAAAPTDPLDTQTQKMRPSGELSVLRNLAERRAQIEQRERELDDREVLLKASEKQFDEKIQQLTSIRDEIKKLLDAAKQNENAETKRLVDVYEKMKPKDAAGIFNSMTIDILLPIVSGMKEAKLSPILAAMQPDKARLITAQLTQKAKILPQDSPAVAAANAATAAQPGGAPALPANPSIAPTPTPKQP